MRFGRKDTGKKRFGIYLTIIIVLLMVGGTVGYVFRGSDGDTSLKYNGYDFIKTGENKIVLVYNDQNLGFDYHPKDLENLPFEAFELDSSKVYTAYDPKDRDQNLDYSMMKIFNFMNFLSIKPVLSCYNEIDCPDIPIVNCDESFPVIQFRKDDVNKVYTDDKCIILSGDAIGLSKSSDRFIYFLLGVMD